MTIEQLLQNQVFSGLGAASIFAWVLYVARSIPRHIIRFFMWRLTCSLTIFSEDAAYEKVNEWLSSLEYTKRCRRLRLGTQYSTDLEEDIDVLSPGIGEHFFWYKKRPIVVSRTLPKEGKSFGGWKRFEDIEIRTFGSNPTVLQTLVKEIRDARKNMHAKTINVFLYRFRWRLACRKPKRAIESVVLPRNSKEGLLSDIRKFLSSRPKYQERGVPYRRGYLLEGPPGCGKTSLVMAIASELERPIYALNLGSLKNDDELIEAGSEVPEHAIMLIEDIDAAKAAAKRAPAMETKAPSAAAQAGQSPNDAIAKAPEEKQEISLSALLNVLDGVFSREGRILFMTTNHPEKVDPALKRPGRADQRIHISELDMAGVLEMCTKFMPNELSAFRIASKVGAPIAAAELQEILVQESF